MLRILLVMLGLFLSLVVFGTPDIYCEGMEVVVWGKYLASNVGMGRFTQLVASMVSFPPYIYGILIGLVLSDGSLRIVKNGKNCHFRFQQSLSHFAYFWFVFKQLSHYCNAWPKLYIRAFKGTFNYALDMHTRSLPCFNELYFLFYVNGVKIVPLDIFNLLTPFALANHCIMGDGHWNGYGLVLRRTHSFTVPDVVRLMNVLMIRYRLDVTLRFERGAPTAARCFFVLVLYSRQKRIIYIRAKSVPLLRSIVLEHMDPSMMLYKLGL